MVAGVNRSLFTPAYKSHHYLYERPPLTPHPLHPRIFSTHDRDTESLVWSTTKTQLEMDIFDEGKHTLHCHDRDLPGCNHHVRRKRWISILPLAGVERVT
jgi:hypothetical protein